MSPLLPPALSGANAAQPPPRSPSSPRPSLSSADAASTRLAEHRALLQTPTFLLAQECIEGCIEPLRKRPRNAACELPKVVCNNAPATNNGPSTLAHRTPGCLADGRTPSYAPTT